MGNLVTTTSTTSTTTITVTTTTEAPYPCSVCPKIYSSGCLGGGSDVCATAAQVGITYTLGVLTGYNYGDSNTCSTVFSCPVATTSKVKLPITGTITPGPSLVIATCQETGEDAGTWYYGIPPLSTPVEIVATSLFLLYYVQKSFGCIPTQNVDDSGAFGGSATTTTAASTTTTTTSTTTTTTTMTTTTTVTEPPYPCTVCQKVYSTTCFGTGLLDFCPTAAEVGLIYFLGIVPGLLFGDADTCSTVFACPLGTTSRVKYPLLGEGLGPALVIASCQETGANAGIWYLGVPPLPPLPAIELVSLTCQGLLSG
ncbi:unnamed protein product [Caenorhabditis sp. 36 PRJEB53466]|nr:unnamed protein product [Caenorhabditis sp. 36 PRJEB53466]